MAIVIKSNPGDYYSAQGDLIFVVFESTKATDPVTYPDYKYVADVYIGGELAVRIKKVPQPDNKMGVFNIGDVIRSYISTQFNPAGLMLKSQELGLSNFFVNATVKFGEEYDFTLYTNVTVDSERIYFNHYNGRMVGQETILASKINLGLTTRPSVTPVNSTDAFTLLPFFPESFGTVNVVVRSYDLNDALLSQITTSIIADEDKSIILFNVSPDVLKVYNSGFLTNAKYYTVIIGYSTFRFNLTCEAKYEVYTLHFLNKYGGFESRNFNKVSRKNIAITKTDFGRLPYSIDASGNVSYHNSNNVYNETRATYSSQFTEKLVLNTDILTDGEYLWLGELILSPLVYIEQEGYFIPCSITNNDYEYKKSINDKLTNLTINVEFGDQLNAQYR